MTANHGFAAVLVDLWSFSSMRYHVAVGTHQKTGTVWMNDVFQQLARTLGVLYKNISRLTRDDATRYVRKLMAKDNTYGLIFHNHSEFPSLVRSGEFRGLHLIRDPRDVVLSAIRYHETTDAKFANRPRPEFRGRSLRQAVSELPSLEEKLLFEIEHVAANNICPMAAMASVDGFLDIRYEDLIDDDDLYLTSKILLFLGFDEYETLLGLISFWQNSLFGQKRGVRTNHIRDGSARQYEKAYSDKALAAFNQKFARELFLLGYDAGTRDVATQALEEIRIPASVQRAREAFAAGGDAGMEVAARLAIELRPESPHGPKQLAELRR